MDPVIQEEVKSPIKQEGNYFIMDSEQLVCNPFQDLQSEAMTEAQKKASMTEKLTSVKNNVCENHFLLERHQLERKKEHTLKLLHDRASKLRYEVKLLDLDRQKHKIEVKKRILPERDYSYDEMQISNTEKRLGANIASFYLERKLKYPTRLKAGSDTSITPAVRQARQALKHQDVSKSAENAYSERAGTAKTTSTTAGMSTASPVRAPLLQRRNSRSAPLVSRSFSARRASPGEETRLPAIVDNQEPRSKPPQVKFMFEDPMKILTADDPLKMPQARDKGESSPLQSRPYTYHPGMELHRERLQSRDYISQEMSDDDDDYSLPDHVDLRAVLFDKEGGHEEVMSTKSVPQSNQVPSPILRRSHTFASKVTQDLILQENNQVQNKVHRFLQELNDNTPHHNDTNSELEADIFSKASAPRTSGPHIPPTQPDKPSMPAEEPQTETAGEDDNNPDENSFHPAARSQTPIPKDAWKYIKGRDLDGSLRGSYKAEDLVLQTLTGVPLTRSLTAGVPLHAASRAMRHTATFKMRKVVERLINDRTKYQQHEVEEIKRKMDQGMDMAAAAASLIPPPTPAPAPPLHVSPSSRKLSHTDTVSSASRTHSRMEPMVPISQGVQA
ncbi:uncharacterized protein LOC143285457 isoform X2 [Babylonia areolata]|uniref:uncharacterized protein LOC143285457 isoform X2 n=1 Tax=Babylonia areolata TaxID=304850 RepID=UPI003FD3B711